MAFTSKVTPTGRRSKSGKVPHRTERHSTRAVVCPKQATRAQGPESHVPGVTLVDPAFLEKQAAIACANRKRYAAVVDDFRRGLVRDLQIPIRYERRKELSGDGETHYSWYTGEDFHCILLRPALRVHLPYVQAHELMHILVTADASREKNSLGFPAFGPTTSECSGLNISRRQYSVENKRMKSLRTCWPTL